MKSLKELYRCGHGPSSSHTMAPFRAAEIFLRKYPEAARFAVTLYGSLAATGKGHFTDRAICSVLSEARTTIHWKPDIFLPEHPNGMSFAAFAPSGEPLGKWNVFSIGGGALSENGKCEETPECYPFKNMNEILELCEKRGIPLWQAAEEWETFEWLPAIYNQMLETLHEGLNREGELPGGLHLGRKARNIHRKARSLKKEIRRTGLIAAYAYAVAEENASLGIVVTAPTCGSSGVLPAVLHYLQEFYHCSSEEMIHALPLFLRGNDSCSDCCRNIRKYRQTERFHFRSGGRMSRRNWNSVCHGCRGRCLSSRGQSAAMRVCRGNRSGTFSGVDLRSHFRLCTDSLY